MSRWWKIVAPTDAGNHAAAIKMIKMQGSAFASVTMSAALIEALP